MANISITGAAPADVSGGVDTRALVVVLMSAAVLFINNGFILVGITAFDSELLARFGVSVGALKIRDAFTFGTVAASGPLAGYLLDRIGVRPLMTAGMVLMAAGMVAYTFANGIAAIYGIHILFGLCLVTSGLFANVMLVAASTERHRGLALGFIIGMSSLGQAIAPTINTFISGGIGWRNTLLVDAALPLLLIPGILAIFPRLNADSYDDAPGAGEGPTYREALAHRNFWLLSVIAMIAFCTQLGIATNTVLYVEKQLRLGAATAGGAVFCFFVTALIAQIVAGWLADRVGSRPVHIVSLILMAAGAAILALTTPGTLWLGMIVFGLGWGGNYSLIQLLTSNLFLGPAIGRILGTIAVIESIGAAAGPAMIGGLYDRSGTYAVPFALSAFLIATTIIAVWALKMPPRRAHAPTLQEEPA